MQRLAPVLFALMIALAGCASSPDYVPPAEPVVEGDPEPEPKAEPEPEPQPNQNATPSAPEPRAPVLDADISAINGTAPLNVTLRLAGSDEDGDSLTWHLFHNGTLNATGTELPINLTVVLGAGNHTLNVTLSDGMHEVNQTFTIIVTAPVAGPQWIEETIRGKSPACLPEAAYDATGEGYVEVAVEPHTIGHPYFAHFASASAFDVLLILDASGAELHRTVVGLSQSDPQSDDFQSWSADGTVPQGAAMLVFAACDNIFDSLPAEADGNPESVRYVAGPEAAPAPFF